MKELFEFLVFILSGLGRILKFLLFKLGLWVPLAFSTVFLVVIAITQTPFESIASLFWFGVILTALLSFVATIGIAIDRKSKKRAEKRSTQSAVQPKEGDAQPTAPMPQYAPYGYPYPAYPYPPYPPQGVQPATYPAEGVGYAPQNQPVQQPTAGDRPTFTSESNESATQQQGGYEGFSRRSRFSEGFSAESYACPQGKPPEEFNDYSFGARDRARFDEVTRTAPPQEETPKIFRTRKDPSVLIYDYSNRVEFYRQTPTGLQFLYKEDKK